MFSISIATRIIISSSFYSFYSIYRVGSIQHYITYHWLDLVSLLSPPLLLSSFLFVSIIALGAVFDQFLKVVDSTQNRNVKSILSQLLNLFAVSRIEKALAWYIVEGIIPAESAKEGIVMTYTYTYQFKSIFFILLILPSTIYLNSILILPLPLLPLSRIPSLNSSNQTTTVNCCDCSPCYSFGWWFWDSQTSRIRSHFQRLEEIQPRRQSRRVVESQIVNNYAFSRGYSQSLYIYCYPSSHSYPSHRCSWRTYYTSILLLYLLCIIDHL